MTAGRLRDWLDYQCAEWVFLSTPVATFRVRVEGEDHAIARTQYLVGIASGVRLQDNRGEEAGSNGRPLGMGVSLVAGSGVVGDRVLVRRVEGDDD